MRVINRIRYGEPKVLHLKEMEKLTPASNEVLIRNYASSVTLYDCWTRSGTAPPGFGLLSRLESGFRKPKQSIIGTEFAGKVEAVGKNVTKFKKDHEVYGFLPSGAYAEYLCLPEDATLAIKPATMTFDEAAVVPQGALTALYFLRKGNIQKKQRVLIIGASGGVGIFAVQIAKNLFECEVTGVCSTSKLELVKSLGADRVIDYIKEDYTVSNKKYDLILDTMGKSSVRKCKNLLNNEGFYLFTTFGMPKLFQILWFKLISRKKIVFGVLEDKPEDLVYLKDQIEAGNLKSVIDKRFLMEQAAEAHLYVESGQKKGQVVLYID